MTHTPENLDRLLRIMAAALAAYAKDHPCQNLPAPRPPKRRPKKEADDDQAA